LLKFPAEESIWVIVSFNVIVGEGDTFPSKALYSLDRIVVLNNFVAAAGGDAVTSPISFIITKYVTGLFKVVGSHVTFA